MREMEEVVKQDEYRDYKRCNGTGVVWIGGNNCNGHDEFPAKCGCCEKGKIKVEKEKTNDRH